MLPKKILELANKFEKMANMDFIKSEVALNGSIKDIGEIRDLLVMLADEAKNSTEQEVTRLSLSIMADRISGMLDHELSKLHIISSLIKHDVAKTRSDISKSDDDDELLKDLNGPDTKKEPWLADQMISIEHGNNLLNKGVESDLPPDFEKHFSFHKERGDRFSEDYYDGDFPFGTVVRQLKLLSEGDPYMWGQVGSAYKGWTPAHVAKLLEKLNEYNGNIKW